MRRITAGTLPVFRAPRRGDRARLSVIWLAALLFALRAFLPTGFMPDPDALRAGRFQIIICSAAGPIPAGMAMIGHGMAHSSHSTMAAAGASAALMQDLGQHDHAPATPDGSNMPADCPFGLTGAYTCTPPVFAVAGPMLSVAWHVPEPAPVSVPLSGIVAGPPVGSRAPPPSLA
ncbi:MAG TPA: hypothetical protein VL522_14765 [Bordetella sp.]|nr:hypothetical protein [Bordetella sp.]